MDIKQQAITEYLTQGVGYRLLAKKYGVSRTTINKWVMIHQGIHNLAPTEKQKKYYLSAMNNKPDNTAADGVEKTLTGAGVPQDHLMPISLSGLCPAFEKQMMFSV